MKILKPLSIFAILLTVLVTGCKKDDFVEAEGVCPEVVSTDPADLYMYTPLNKIVTATFNVNMNPETFVPESFILLDDSQTTNAEVEGTVSYNAGTKTMSFTPSTQLSNNTSYTARIRSIVKDLNGIALAADYVWNFSVFASVPKVISTSPVSLDGNVVTYKTVTATFSTAMLNTTLSGTTFTLYNGPTQVAGAVSYAGTTAYFNPTVDLLPGVEYTATITTGAQNVNGAALASNYTWKFTTLAAGVPFVISTIPADLATNIPLSQNVSADFSEVMSVATISPLTFTLMDGANPVSGSVNYVGTTATFTPDVALLPGTTYTATITTGAEDMGGTGLATDHVWRFSTGATVSVGSGPVNLGSAANFTILAKSGISTTGVTSITGNIGVSPASATAITGFALIMDPSNQFSKTPIVSGNVYASNYAIPTPTYVSTAISDMENALTTAMGMTLSVITELGEGNISGMTLAPGLYKWGTGLLVTGAGVTLSGGPNDTWVFQVSSDFTVNGDIVLAGGAQAKNIFWVTNTQALINTGVQFNGNILAQTLISLNAGSMVRGRLLSQTAVTLNAATVILP